ncbi:hypothetical protein GCM10017783_13190 [Deinococcus piscis]|uniref:VTC domain-containing protein n=1 Tax=Deinococcus piscis TaxID=394230 RepID=A0ABQ3K3K3_9DEIO|nr:VTC domain-containing protein [Deinococcus piscis]GHG02294.1 hypothetical protein GCM10017783_13190 [Deinococcus piscis]
MDLSVKLSPLIAGFQPISLSELSGAELMDRRETKYTLPASELPRLLQALQGQYRVLTVGGTALQGYASRYFDTPEFSFFYDQYVRKNRRHKVRWRRYASTGAGFLEIKRQDGGVTHKVRVASQGDVDAQRRFLETHGIDADQLCPAVDVLCERLTLVRTGPVPERVTLDLNLRLISEQCGAEHQFAGAVIVELKSEVAAQHTHFAQFAAQFGLHADQVSKYSVAVALHYPQVKSNLIRPQLRLLRRVQQQGALA